MTGKADVQTHLDQRRGLIEALFREWSRPDASADERASMVERYFDGSNAGATQRVGRGNSVRVTGSGHDARRRNVLVVGRHDTVDLAVGPSPPGATTEPTGPGLASRLGPTIAFAEGIRATRSLTDDDPVNVVYLSLGDNDTFSSVVPTIAATAIDAVFLTNAVAWSPDHPTITTGSRGQIVAELSLTAGGPIDDYVASGAVRNPLTTMTQLLGALRDDRGRIALPGFYERANPPAAGTRTAMAADGHDPNEWSAALGIAAPSGQLSGLERAALWPGVSVLDIERESRAVHPEPIAAHAALSTAPASVTATVAIYLVPDQRHAEVERALRKWFMANVPADLQPRMKLLSSSRPYRTPADSVAVAAQARAAYRLYGRNPILVPAGGPAGSGEAAFTMGVPVAFAGLVPPSGSYGTSSEVLPWSHFAAGVALAAETALELRRP